MQADPKKPTVKQGFYVLKFLGLILGPNLFSFECIFVSHVLHVHTCCEFDHKAILLVIFTFN